MSSFDGDGDHRDGDSGDDFMDGDKFPDRPNTPDFWRLSDTVLQQDGATEDTDIEDIVAGRCDLGSLAYMATQRASGVLGEWAHPDAVAKLAAVWMDGFLAGQGFESKGGHRE